MANVRSVAAEDKPGKRHHRPGTVTVWQRSKNMAAQQGNMLAQMTHVGCPKCSLVNPAHAAVCMGCGAPLGTVSPNAGMAFDEAGLELALGDAFQGSRQEDASERSAQIGRVPDKLLADSQDKPLAEQGYTAAMRILVPGEAIECIGTSNETDAAMCVLATNKRLMVYSKEALAGGEPNPTKSYYWRDVLDLRTAENGKYMTLTAVSVQGRKLEVAGLPRPQGRRLYTYGVDHSEQVLVGRMQPHLISKPIAAHEESIEVEQDEPAVQEILAPETAPEPELTVAATEPAMGVAPGNISTELQDAGLASTADAESTTGPAPLAPRVLRTANREASTTLHEAEQSQQTSDNAGDYGEIVAVSQDTVAPEHPSEEQAASRHVPPPPSIYAEPASESRLQSIMQSVQAQNEEHPVVHHTPIDAEEYLQTIIMQAVQPQEEDPQSLSTAPMPYIPSGPLPAWSSGPLSGPIGAPVTGTLSGPIPLVSRTSGALDGYPTPVYTPQPDSTDELPTTRLGRQDYNSGPMSAPTLTTDPPPASTNPSTEEPWYSASATIDDDKRVELEASPKNSVKSRQGSSATQWDEMVPGEAVKKLKMLKELLDLELINQSDYDTQKKKILLDL